MKIKGNYVDVVGRRIFKAELEIHDRKIASVQAVENCSDIYILPGLVDAHVHIESSMLVPQEFAKVAVKHGTVATVSDPHEIANVMGVKGVDFMINNAKNTPFKFYFGAPSCVPATLFETSGHVLDADDIRGLLKRDDIFYLSEMMNFPGVIYNEKGVLDKIKIAKEFNKPIDGHAPGLKGEDLIKYADAGITTDHESVSAEEAMEKINLGIKLLIREGSAAKNFDSLIDVISKYPDDIMFCTDDCHPDDLIEKHIMDHIKRAISKGYDFFDILRAASYNPVKHYHLNVGLLQKDDCADLIIVDNLQDLNVLETYIDGKLVYKNGESYLKSSVAEVVNNFKCVKILKDDIVVRWNGTHIKVILAFDGDLYTGKEIIQPTVENGNIVSDIERDILKIVVLNRYYESEPVVGFIKNFGLKKGAIAGSIAHDSHNIICVGVNDEDITVAINSIIESKGGIVAVNGKEVLNLELPVAGLMSDKDAFWVAEKYKQINAKPIEWGSTLHAPFMTLSFMALLVIPELKISDKGLFDGKKFGLTSLYD